MSYIITQKEIITRKDHKCFGCERKFPRNTKMLRTTVKDDIIFTAYLCKTCQAIRNERCGDEFCESDLYELAVEAEQAFEKMEERVMRDELMSGICENKQTDKLIEVVNEYFGCDSAYFGIHTLDFAKWLIDHNVVEVVRCKDCKESEAIPAHCLWCNFYEHPVLENGFCHCGEKRMKQ